MRDEFNAVSCSSNDGSRAWFNEWQEVGENRVAGPSDGEVGVVGGRLRLGKNDYSNPYPAAWRVADLCGAT